MCTRPINLFFLLCITTSLSFALRINNGGCGNQLYSILTGLTQSQGDAFFWKTFSACGNLPFDNTTCDGAAQFLDIILNMKLSQYMNTTSTRSAICNHMRENIKQQMSFFSSVMTGQNDADKQNLWKKVQDIVSTPMGSSNRSSFARIAFVLYRGTPPHISFQSAHTFVIQRDDSISSEPLFYVWQANEGEFDLWSWVNQNCSLRKNPNSCPSPPRSPNAGPMDLVHIKQYLQVLQDMLVQPAHVLWSTFQPLLEVQVEWTLENDIIGRTDFQPTDIVGSLLFIESGQIAEEDCSSNLSILSKF